MTLRSDQVELTKQRILDAVLDISTEADVAISVSEVARRSGISPATIYRHFPSRDVLVEAAANSRVSIGVRDDVETWGAAEQRSHLLALWSDLAKMPGLARLSVTSEAGRELRAARFGGFKPLLDAALAEAGVDPDSDDGRHLSACVHVLQSGYAFLDLHDRQGLGVEAAVESITWGIETLLRAVGIDATSFGVTIPDRPDEAGSS